VQIQLARGPAWRRQLFDRALDSGLKRLDGKRLSPLEWAVDPLLDRLVRQKVRDRFGGRLKGVMSGGARLEPEVGRFFLALGLPVLQGYGQTEAGPVISANPPEAIRIDTVGPKLRGVDLRIADDGEVLVRGELVMAGYWGQLEATAAAIQDGWLHTGDIGVLDPDGYLRITDRKKDMIVLSGGDNVAPARVEGMLVSEPEIAQAVVLGDGKAALSALLVAADGHDAASVAQAVARVNARLSVVERVRRHVLVEAFTQENGLMTPTMKVRRRAVMERFGGELG
jgi:long-chain acyl-CoA synthetase